MQKLLKSFFGQNYRSESSRRSQSRKRAFGRAAHLSRSTGAEVLENRTLLAAQMISSDAVTKTVTPGQEIQVPVLYRTLDNNGDPAALQASQISFNLHFDSDLLEFKETVGSTIFPEDIFRIFPTSTRLENDSSVIGSDAADDPGNLTDTVLVVAYTDSGENPITGTKFGWPDDPATTPLQMYIATFNVPLDFSGSTKINFSANATGTVIGQAADFEFQSQSLTLSTQPDQPPSVSIANAPAVNEGGNAVFNVTLSQAASGPVTVNYSTANGTATGGADFTAQTNQTLTFATGQTSQTISVPTLSDAVAEPAENFTVSLSSSVGATIGTGTATGTINDVAPALPRLSIANAPAVNEGGTSMFTVSLSAAASSNVTVNYSTASGTATSGADFTAQANQTLTFAPGQTSQNINVATLGDAVTEAVENFSVSLASPVGATIATGTATGTINDVPPALPTLSIANAAAVTEGGNSVFNVTLSANPAGPVTVNFATAGTGANPATSGSDFTAQAATMTFNPGGPLTQQVTVSTIDDVIIESTETLSVTLSAAVGATIAQAVGVGTIVDNDPNGATGQIHGRKYNDLNANGQRDSAEPGLNGWTIQLLNSAGTVVDEQVTADMDLNGDNQIDPLTESGWYWFTATPGSYRLREVAQPGWQQTAPTDHLPALAFELDSQLLFRETANEFLNWGGLNEKWVLADGNDWYFITPNGTLFEWNGSPQANLTGTVVDTLSPEYHEDLSLLYDAAPAQYITYTVIAGQAFENIDFGNVSLDDSGSIHGRKWHDLNGDGQRSSDEPWLNGWEIELVDRDGNVVQTTTTMDMDVNGDDSIDPETESGWYWLNGVGVGGYTVREVVQPGWEQTAPVDPVRLQAAELDSELNLRFSRSLFPNWGGLNERWMLGDDAWYYITPNGDFFEWNRSPRNNLSGNLVASLSPRFHADPALLYDSQDPFAVPVRISPGDIVTDVNFGNREETGPGGIPTDFAGVGNVEVRVVRDNLVLVGDNGANGVVLFTNADGWITVAGLGDTMVQGQSEPWVLEGWTAIPGNLNANLKDGNDALILHDVQIAGHVDINLEKGDDYVLADDVMIGRTLDIRDNYGSNTVVARDVQVGSWARVVTGSGHDAFYTERLSVAGNTVVTTKGGNDIFVPRDSSFGGNVSLNGGTGHDQVAIVGNSSFGGRVTLDGKGGTDAVSADPATVYSKTPKVLRFEQDSVDLNALLDEIMGRLADAGLDGLIGAS